MSVASGRPKATDYLRLVSLTAERDLPERRMTAFGRVREHASTQQVPNGLQEIDQNKKQRRNRQLACDCTALPWSR